MGSIEREVCLLHGFRARLLRALAKAASDVAPGGRILLIFFCLETWDLKVLYFTPAEDRRNRKSQSDLILPTTRYQGSQPMLSKLEHEQAFALVLRFAGESAQRPGSGGVFVRYVKGFVLYS